MVSIFIKRNDVTLIFAAPIFDVVNSRKYWAFFLVAEKWNRIDEATVRLWTTGEHLVENEIDRFEVGIEIFSRDVQTWLKMNKR